MIGFQNRSPAHIKDASSIVCQAGDDKPSWKKKGMCHTTTVVVPASQQKMELPKRPPSDDASLVVKSKLPRATQFGSPPRNPKSRQPGKRVGAVRRRQSHPREYKKAISIKIRTIHREKLPGCAWTWICDGINKFTS